MKKRTIISKRTIVGLIISTLILLSLSWNTTIVKPSINNYQVKNPSILALTPHDPIEIISDDNFTDYGFPGTGIAEDPYIIEGYSIITTIGSGIYITGTTKYFTVRNCYVDAKECGIYIEYITSGTNTIINNTCTNNNAGIFLYFSGSSTVANNSCTYNGDGINMQYLGSSTVVNNSCANNDYYGISLSNCGSSTVANNSCIDNWNGIVLYSSGSSTVANNSFLNDGLYISEPTLENYLSYTIEHNYVNEKPFGYYTNLINASFTEPVYGQLFLVNCTGVTVCNQLLDNTDVGLSIHYSDQSTIINNSCSNNGASAIILSSSGSSTIANNSCTNNGASAIILSSSGSSTVANNSCIDNSQHGIYLDSSGSSTVANNSCTSNLNGIYLVNSGSSTIANNSCAYSWDGIELLASGLSTVSNNKITKSYDSAIRISSSGSSTIASNIITTNFGYGIYLRSSSDSCILTYNLLRDNEDYGIYITNSNDSLIHHNTFVDNNLGGTSQAYDEGTNNIWYDLTYLEGNYWSDWSGTGSYSIDGSADAIDPYPLGEPTVAEFTRGFNILILVIALSLAIIPLSLIFKRKLTNS